MANLLRQIRQLNGLGGRAIAEPFAGGAGAALTLLYLEEAAEIQINDADPAIHDFWWTLVNRPGPMLEKIATTAVSIAEWRRQRDVYRETRPVSRLRRGFAAFYLNRCNRSGIIRNGGPIGGTNQSGKWRLDARFNRDELLRRCTRVTEYGSRIRVSGEDGKDFIKTRAGGATFFFIDPPYFARGKTLYLNDLDEKYHVGLATQLKAMTAEAWVLTYDDCPEIREMYDGWAKIQPFSLQYSAAKRRGGKEVLVVPKWMDLPMTQTSAAITW